MSWTRTDRRLHWIMAALFVWQFVSRWVSDALPPDHGLMFLLIGLHSLGGYAIFVLGAFRLVYRLRNGRPPLLEASPSASWAAYLAHAFLYVVMFVQPVSGFLAVGAEQYPVLTPSRSIHVIGGWVILGLLALHVAAALWHHLVRGDDTLRRMLRETPR